MSVITDNVTIIGDGSSTALATGAVPVIFASSGSDLVHYSGPATVAHVASPAGNYYYQPVLTYVSGTFTFTSITGGSTITETSGINFVTAGFAPGQKIMASNSSSYETYTIQSVTTTVITITASTITSLSGTVVISIADGINTVPALGTSTIGMWVKEGPIVLDNIAELIVYGVTSSVVFVSDPLTGGRFSYKNNITYTGSLVYACFAYNGSLTYSGSTISNSSANFLSLGFAIGQAITVSGSMYNDGIYAISFVTATELTVCSTLITETTTSTVAIANKGTITGTSVNFLSLGFATGQTITITGTTYNNGTYLVANVTSTVISVAWVLTAETATTPLLTVNPDNGTTFPASQIGTGYWQRLYDPAQGFSVSWFGAVGDGVTDDTSAIQGAINAVYALGGGELRFAAKTYAVTTIAIKRGVNLTGAEMHPASSQNTGYTGTIISAILQTPNTQAIATINYDGLETSETGAETCLSKSAPNIEVKSIYFRGNQAAKYCVYIAEAWAVSFDKCRMDEAIAFGLYIFDCNDFNVKNCVVHCLYLNNCADYNVDQNEIQGTLLLPAYTFVDNAFGVTGSNKVYASSSNINPILDFSPTSVDTTGLFTGPAAKNLLPAAGANWIVWGGVGSTSYDASTGTLTLTSVNGSAYKAENNVTPILQNGKSYTLTCTLELMSSSVSSSRGVNFTSGSEEQTYGSVTINNGTPLPVSIPFTFSPLTTAETAPLKLYITAASGITGTDTVVMTNLSVSGDISDLQDKLPVIVNFNESVVTSEIINNLPLSNVFYISMISPTTFRLASSCHNYVHNEWITFSTSYAFSSGELDIYCPRAVVAVVGQNDNATFVNNKIEDIYNIGVQLRGAYGNVFTGNAIMKSDIAAANTVAVSLEAGSTENTFSGSFIGCRMPVTEDGMNNAIIIDQYSFRNRFSGLTTQNCRSLDIVDNYVGTSDLLNVYDETVTNNCFVSLQRPTDFNIPVQSQGYSVTKNLPSQIVYPTSLIQDDEFSLLFTNVIFQGNSADVFLFSQTSSGAAGRINIKRTGSSKNLTITSETSVVFISASTFANDIPFDILVMRDISYNWYLYVNGEAVVNTLGPVTQNPISTSSPSYIGGLGTPAETFTLTRFRYFTDLLSDAEITTLFSSGYLDKNNQNVTLLLDSDSGSSIVGSDSGVTLTYGVSGVGGSSTGIQVAITSNSNAIKLNEDQIADSLRISLYAQSSDTPGIRFTRNINFVFNTLGSSFQKYIFYMRPNGRGVVLTSANVTTIKFGVQDAVSSALNFEPVSSGTVVIDKLKVWLGAIPVLVDLDLTQTINGNYIYNDCSTTQFYQWTVWNTNAHAIELADFYSDNGNSGTTETTLYTYTLAANALLNLGEKINATFAGKFVNSATATRELKLYFGGNVIWDSGALTTATPALYWEVTAMIMKESSTTIKYAVKLSINGTATQVYYASIAGITFTVTNVLQITGTAAGTGAATNDIEANIGNIEWRPAAS